jgi:hypothetical protein
MNERRRFKQAETLEVRCAGEARRLREVAELLPHGPVRDIAVRKALEMETASHMSDWLESPGLRRPQ